MIDRVQGVVQAVNEARIVVLVGGVGFDISVPHAATISIGEEVMLSIHWQWSHEQGPALYGFADEADRFIFRCLLSCQGLGARTALQVLRDLSRDEIVAAVCNEKPDIFARVTGIGKKRAEQMIRQLIDKRDMLQAAIPEQSGYAVQLEEVRHALHALRYSSEEISYAVAAVRQHDITDKNADQLLRAALKSLAQRRS